MPLSNNRRTGLGIALGALMVVGAGLWIPDVLWIPDFRIRSSRMSTDTTTEAEALVKTFLKKQADEQGLTIQFLKFGPHMTREEITVLVSEAGVELGRGLPETVEGCVLMMLNQADCVVRVRMTLDQADRVIRVRERGLYLIPDGRGGYWTDEPPWTNKPSKGVFVYDQLFLVRGNIVEPEGKGSDDWKTDLRKGLFAGFPFPAGIRRP
jgi:hypothetical protein